jgi:hypothetical protein
VVIRSRRTPAAALPTSAARSRRSNLAADYPTLSLQPIQALGEHQHIPLILLALDVVDLSLSLGQNGTRRRAPLCRTASAAARAAQSIPEPRLSLRRITHVALNLPSPSSSCFDPRSIDFDGTPASPEPRCRGNWSPASSAAARAPRCDTLVIKYCHTLDFSVMLCAKCGKSVFKNLNAKEKGLII